MSRLLMQEQVAQTPAPAVATSSQAPFTGVAHRLETDSQPVAETQVSDALVETKVIEWNEKSEKALTTLRALNAPSMPFKVDSDQLEKLEKAKTQYLVKHLADMQSVFDNTTITMANADASDSKCCKLNLEVPTLNGSIKLVFVYLPNTTADVLYNLLGATLNLDMQLFQVQFHGSSSVLMPFDNIDNYNLDSGMVFKLMPKLAGGVKKLKEKSVKKDGNILKQGLITTKVNEIQLKEKFRNGTACANVQSVIADSLVLMDKLYHSHMANTTQAFGIILEKMDDATLGSDLATSPLMNALRNNKADLRLENLGTALTRGLFKNLHNIMLEVDGIFEGGSLTVELVITQAFFSEKSGNWDWKSIGKAIANEIQSRKGSEGKIEELTDALDAMEL